MRHRTYMSKSSEFWESEHLYYSSYNLTEPGYENPAKMLFWGNYMTWHANENPDWTIYMVSSVQQIFMWERGGGEGVGVGLRIFL